jgi:effector-binding domain-containing protein
MKALKIIGVVLLVLIALVLVVALFLPKSVSMKESIVINKPASLIYQQVNDYHNWPAWSPWNATDPAMVMNFEGPAKGVGSKNVWTSKVHGDGSLTTTETTPYKSVKAKLDFGQKGDAVNFFEFNETGQGTEVVWGVDINDMGYPLGRYIALMMPGMMNPFFSQGLEKLKAVAEAMPDPPSLQVVEMPVRNVIAVRDSCSWNDIGMKMGEMFGELMTYTQKNKVAQTGYPLSAYYVWDEVNQFTVFENWLPVAGEVPSKGRVQFKQVPASKAIMGTHFGAYDETMYLYVAMDEYMSDFGLKQAGGPIEEYVTDPMMEPDTAKWQTNVYFPIQ